MGFRGYLPVTYRSYYAITTWGPLMGPMLCTKESRYVRMQLRSTVYTRVQKTRSHAPRVAAFIAYTHPIQPSTVLSILEETVTHEIQYFRYVTFEQAAAFTATTAPWLETRRRHDACSFFFYCLIETLGDALLRADLIYYPCDCTELLITELRQLRRWYVRIHVRSCFLSVNARVLKRDGPFFPPPSNTLFEFRFAIVRDIRAFSSLRGTNSWMNNTKICGIANIFHRVARKCLRNDT